jgi:GTP-binding protein
MSRLARATYFKTASRLADLPVQSVAEVAFAGRSNAGKSSAINALTGQSRLAYVSKTPGRTQQINYFDLGESRYLVDLPGYGFARVPEAVKKHWQALLAKYLSKREALAGLVLIMDARHPLTPLDRQMLGWFAPTGRPIHILLTKADKLSRSEAKQALMKVQSALAACGVVCGIQLFSSLKREGLEEAESILLSWLYK